MTSPLREVVADALPESNVQAERPDCPRCGGAGGWRWRDPGGEETGEKCSTCDGFGYVAATQPAASPGVEERARELVEDVLGSLLGEEAIVWVETSTDGKYAEKMHALCNKARESIAAALRTPAKTGGDVGRVVERVLSKWEELAASCDAESLRLAKIDERTSREIARDAGQYRACIGGLRNALAALTEPSP